MKTQLYTDRIDIAPSADAFAAIDQALDTIEANADFLHSLTSERRMVLRGLSHCNESFANEALEIGMQNEELMPRGLDLAQIERDKIAREQLKERLQRLRRITGKFDDTVLLLGSDFYNGALAIYAALKRFGQGAGLREALQALGKKFRRKKGAEVELPAL